MSTMSEKFSPELLALLSQMQTVAAKDPLAASLVARIKQDQPEAFNASNKLWEPSSRTAAPAGPDPRLMEPSSREVSAEPFAFTNNPDQRLYTQELAKAMGVGGNPTLADLMMYRKFMDEQQRQPQQMAMAPEDE